MSVRTTVVGAAFGLGGEDCVVTGGGGRERRDLGEVVGDLSPEVLREIVASAYLRRAMLVST